MPTHEGGQTRPQRQQDKANDVEEDGSQSNVAERLEQVDEDVEALLTEIDDVLEENAEDFVRAFVQKGGQ